MRDNIVQYPASMESDSWPLIEYELKRPPVPFTALRKSDELLSPRSFRKAKKEKKSKKKKRKRSAPSRSESYDRSVSIQYLSDEENDRW